MGYLHPCPSWLACQKKDAPPCRCRTVTRKKPVVILEHRLELIPQAPVRAYRPAPGELYDHQRVLLDFALYPQSVGRGLRGTTAGHMPIRWDLSRRAHRPDQWHLERSDPCDDWSTSDVATWVRE